MRRPLRVNIARPGAIGQEICLRLLIPIRVQDPESLATFLKTHQKGGASCDEDSVGGTPTDAVETTALPKKSLMIGAADARAAIKLPPNHWGCGNSAAFCRKPLRLLSGPAAGAFPSAPLQPQSHPPPELEALPAARRERTSTASMPAARMATRPRSVSS